MTTTIHQKAGSIIIALILAGLVLGTTCAAADPTTLEITAIKSGIGKVCMTVKNTGNENATNVTLTISVTGGLLHRINVTKVCGGCGNCSNIIPPNGTKTECAKGIFGLGSVTIAASAEALNADKVNVTKTGVVLGPFVIIK